jgi:hypothetical protein
LARNTGSPLPRGRTGDSISNKPALEKARKRCLNFQSGPEHCLARIHPSSFSARRKEDKPGMLIRRTESNHSEMRRRSRQWIRPVLPVRLWE